MTRENKKTDRRLGPREVEAVLRRSSQMGVRRWRALSQGSPSVSPEVLVQVAAAAGIPESDARLALDEVFTDRAADPPTYPRTLLGPSRLREIREIGHPASEVSEYIEDILRAEQGLKLRYRGEGNSVWDPGSSGGVMRRSLDLSGERPLHKTRSIEVSVEEIDNENCVVDVISDVASQRAEYLSLAGILGVTLAVMFVFAGIQSWVWFLGVIPALLAPLGGFRLAYMKTGSDVRRAVGRVLDLAEAGPPREYIPDQANRQRGQIQGLKPIPRFTPQSREGERGNRA